MSFASQPPGIAMGSTNSAIRAASILLLALLPAAALTTYVYLGYAETRQVELTGRNHRALAAVARQLEAQLQAARGAWKTACASGKRSELERVALPCVVVDAPTTDFTVDGIATPPTCPVRDRDDDAVTITFEPRRSVLRIKDKGEAKCSGHVALDCFVRKAISAPPEFDVILLATKQAGTLLGEAGSVQTRVETIFDLPPGDDKGKLKPVEPNDRALVKGRAQTVLIAQVPYVPFVQSVMPIRIAGVKSDDEMLVIGLVSHNRFRAEQFEMPFRWMLLSALLLMLALVSWPILKLWFMGPGERLNGIDARVLVVTSIVATTLVTGASYGTISMLAASRQLETRMEDLSRRLHDRLRHELASANTALTELGKSLAATTTSQGFLGCPSELRLATTDASVPGPTVLIDPTGRPLCRWEPDVKHSVLRLVDAPSPCLNDRRYFRDARSGTRLWGDVDAGEEPFALEVVRSRIDATNLLSLARLVPPAADHTETSGAILVTTRESVAFRAPTLPHGFGFAIVDRTGEVQLHSDPRRNLEENLLREVDDPTTLATAIRMQVRRDLRLRYGGADHRALVRPIATTEWSIVVFADERAFRGVFTEILTRWAMLVLSYLGGGLVALAVVQVVNERYRVPWLWPDRRGVTAGGYLGVAAALALLAIAGTTAFEWGGVPLRLGVLVATPLATVAIAYGIIRRQKRRHLTDPVQLPAGARPERYFRAAYVVMVGAMLFVVAGLPAAWLWEDATEATLGELDVAIRDELKQADGARLRDQRIFCAERPARCASNTTPPTDAGSDWKPLAPDDAPAANHLGLDDYDVLPGYSPLAARLRVVENDRVHPVRLSVFPIDSDALALVPTVPWAVALLVGIVVTIAIAMGLIWSVITHLFLLDVDRADLLDVPPPSEATAVWILSIRANPLVLAAKGSNAHALVDLRWLPAIQDLRTWFLGAHQQHTLQIDHLEARLGDAAWESALLDGLETAMGRAATIVLTSAIDPLFHLDERATLSSKPSTATATASTGTATPATPAALAERWARILACFTVERHDLRATSSELTDKVLLVTYPQHVLRTMHSSVAECEATLLAAHRQIWNESTQRERLAMTHLAQEGFLNPNDVTTARQLFRRRLVYRDEQFRFVTPAFKRFARYAATPEEVQSWEADAAGLWAQVRFPLQAGLALVGALLLWTQEELRTATVAIPTVVTSTLPLLIRVLSKLGGDASTPKASK